MTKKLRKFFWIYAHPVGSPLKGDIYKNFRAPPWLIWKEGMTGSGVWTYRNARWKGWEDKYKTTWGFNWGMVYRSDDKECPPEVSRKELVVPGKRWEAIREGIEDNAYLDLLTQAIAKASPEDAAKAKKLLDSCVGKVLKDDKNPLLAEKMKKQIMEKIVKMKAK